MVTSSKALHRLLDPSLAKALGDRVNLFESVDSTNLFLAQQTLPALCIAWSQTDGRGRHGKVWQSTPGNLALSLCWPFASYQSVQGLSFTSGVALANCLIELGLQPKLKWPNDLLIDDHKVAGILVESHETPQQIMAVIGIGLNVLCCPTQATEGLATTCLAQIIKESELPKKLDLCAAIANQLFIQIVRLQTLGFATIRKDWLQLACWLGKRVRVGEEKGVYKAIDEQGCLLLETDKEIKHIHSGSLRLFR